MIFQWRVKSQHTNRSTDRLAIWDREHEVRNGVAQGKSDNQIAANLGVCAETVMRIRWRLGLPNVYGKRPARELA